MPYVVMHRGVPVGHIDRPRLTSGNLLVGELSRAPAYDALHPLILSASRSLWSVGFLSSGSVVDTVRRTPLEILSRAAELELELRTAQGEQVPTDFVNIVERPSSELLPVVFARIRLQPAGRQAPLAPSEVGGPARNRRKE